MKKDKIVQLKKNRGAGVKFSPYLVSADESSHMDEKKPLFDRLDRKHMKAEQISPEGFIEIDLVGCEALELVEGSGHDTMIHHGWDRVKPPIQSVESSENRAAARYTASEVRVFVKPVGFFEWSELKRACLLDFSVNGIGLVCGKRFGVNKKVSLKVEFPGGDVFEMAGLVVRNEKSQRGGVGSFSGVLLDKPSQEYRDRVLEEGLQRKLR